MKLIPVKVIPPRRSRHNLQDFLDAFMSGNDEIVKIDLNEHDYASAKVCYACMRAAVRRSRYYIRVAVRGGEVYLQKV